MVYRAFFADYLLNKVARRGQIRRREARESKPCYHFYTWRCYPNHWHEPGQWRGFLTTFGMSWDFSKCVCPGYVAAVIHLMQLTWRKVSHNSGHWSCFTGSFLRGSFESKEPFRGVWLQGSWPASSNYSWSSWACLHWEVTENPLNS